MKRKIFQIIIVSVMIIAMLTGCTKKNEISIEQATPTPSAASTDIQEEINQPTLTTGNETVVRSEILELDGISDELKQIAKFLSGNQEVHLATLGADGNPSIHRA